MFAVFPKGTIQSDCWKVPRGDTTVEMVSREILAEERYQDGARGAAPDELHVEAENILIVKDGEK